MARTAVSCEDVGIDRGSAGGIVIRRPGSSVRSERTPAIGNKRIKESRLRHSGATVPTLRQFARERESTRQTRRISVCEICSDIQLLRSEEHTSELQSPCNLV